MLEILFVFLLKFLHYGYLKNSNNYELVILLKLYEIRSSFLFLLFLVKICRGIEGNFCYF